MTSMDTARRVTVVTPTARVDVALPALSAVAELLPQLMALSGVTDARVGGGWSLSRLGGAALDGGMSVSSAGVRDGEVLYLRPRATLGAPLLFDDVIDAIASAAETPRTTWQPVTARWTALVGSVPVLALLGVALYLAGSTHSVAALSCAAYALVLAVVGGALGRAYGDTAAGLCCAAAGLVPAYLAGAAATTDDRLWPVGASTVAPGLAAVCVFAVLAAVLVADRLPWFTAVVGAGAVGAAGSATVLVSDARPASAASVCLAVALISGFLAPMLALRLSRLPLPRVPADADAFREDETATLGRDVLDRTSEAAGLLAGLLAAAGLVLAASVLVLLHDGRPIAVALAAVGAAAGLLRSRNYAGTPPRLMLLTAGGLAAVSVAISQLLQDDPQRRLIVAGVCALAAVLGLGYAGRVARGRTSPYWSRLLDLAELASTIAVLPVAGAVIGVYSAVRR